VGDPVEDNFPRSRLSPLNRVLLRGPVQEDIQFRHFGNPTAVDFTVQLDRELHIHSLSPWFGPPHAEAVAELLRSSKVWRGTYGCGPQDDIWPATAGAHPRDWAFPFQNDAVATLQE